jgi:thioredoxin reductase (NADPH)
VYTNYRNSPKAGKSFGHQGKRPSRFGGSKPQYSQRARGQKGPVGEYLNPARFINKVVVTEESQVYKPENTFSSFLIDERLKQNIVTKVNFNVRPFKIYTDEEECEAEAVIIATGATAKRMNIKGEHDYWQRGISACAVCDGALPIFRNKELAVIGGGDSAVEEATHLTKFASKVYLIHRRDKLRASQVMQERAINHPKIQMVWNSTVEEAIGGAGGISAITLKDTVNGSTKNLPVGGLFYAIGHTPNTEIFKEFLELDEVGYIKTVPGSTRTNVEGVFAAGDVQDRIYRQAISAAGSGCMAALDAERWLMH